MYLSLHDALRKAVLKKHKPEAGPETFALSVNWKYIPIYTYGDNVRDQDEGMSRGAAQAIGPPAGLPRQTFFVVGRDATLEDRALDFLSDFILLPPLPVPAVVFPILSSRSSFFLSLLHSKCPLRKRLVNLPYPAPARVLVDREADINVKPSCRCTTRPDCWTWQRDCHSMASVCLPPEARQS
jgi:hypothetical protein